MDEKKYAKLEQEIISENAFATKCVSWHFLQAEQFV